MGEAVTGGCLCGAIRFEITERPRALVNCHCRSCRRAHGAAFVTTAPIPDSALTVTLGEESIARHDGRAFCRRCATRLFNRSDDAPGLTALIVTTLDTEPTFGPALHINVESKAPWYDISDDRPQHPGFPPGTMASSPAKP